MLDVEKALDRRFFHGYFGFGLVRSSPIDGRCSCQGVDSMEE